MAPDEMVDGRSVSPRCAWWAWVDSNYRPHAYQACALTGLSYRPIHGRTRQRFWPKPLSAALVHRRKRNEDGGDPQSDGRSHLLCSKGSETNRHRKTGDIGKGSFLRKEVIQPQVPLRLPCYDFTPVADPTVVCCLLAVSAQPSGRTNSHGVTGGVYKARERIHRGMLIHDY